MENISSDDIMIGLSLAVVIGGFVLMVARTLSAHGEKLSSVEQGQKLILKKIDLLVEHGEDIAVLKNDVITIYKRIERDCA